MDIQPAIGHLDSNVSRGTLWFRHTDSNVSRGTLWFRHTDSNVSRGTFIKNKKKDILRLCKRTQPKNKQFLADPSSVQALRESVDIWYFLK
jgi:hypothetical protein